MTNTNKNLTWRPDNAYSCEETAHLGDFAAVIVPPEFYGEDGCWGYQIFDEADEGAMDNGEWFTAAHGLRSRDAAKKVAATILEELAAARA